MNTPPHPLSPRPATRRQFLLQAGGGCGAWPCRGCWPATASPPIRPARQSARAKPPHFEAKAKAVIFLFMVGGPSHIDLFDPKPELVKHQGKPLPESFGRPVSQFTKGDTPLLASTRTFKKYGQSGLEVSDLMPNLAGCVDDIAFLRSCWCTSTVHAPAMYELHTGRTQMGWPSLGSWVTYGLGSVSDDLPAYCVMLQPEGTPEGGAPLLGRRFPARRLSGHAAAQGRQPHPESQAAGRRRRRASSGAPSTCSAR